MTVQIRTSQIVKDMGLVTAYYLYGDYPMDDNEILLGVSVECSHLPGWHHVSFCQYRNSQEMPDTMIQGNELDKAFRFYAEYVHRMADEYLESREWELQMKDNADARIILDS